MAAKKTTPAEQCADSLEQQLSFLKRRITNLRAQIKRVPASVKPALQREIDDLEAEIDRYEAELISIATEQADGDFERYESLHRRWLNVQGDSPRQDLISMIVHLKCFPVSVISLTRHYNWRENRSIGLALTLYTVPMSARAAFLAGSLASGALTADQ